MTKEETLALIRKYNARQCTEEETALLESWYVTQDKQYHQEVPEAVIDEILEQIHLALPRPRKVAPLWKKVAVAATSLLMLSAGFYYGNRLSDHNSALHPHYAADAAPGGNRATLTLASGKVIDLNAAVHGKLTEQAGISVSKTASGQLVYQVSGADPINKNPIFNTLNTPKGGTYLVVLPDQSRVWLNAASQLVFPLRFSERERRVELKGEAYFEISKDTDHPFVVSTARQDIKVLGTHFTVNAYEDEPGTKTTLIEGSVQVTAKGDEQKYLVLKPNQQSLLTTDFRVKQVNAGSENAWINGKFIFDDEPLESILRKVARWYDIKVVYHDDAVRQLAFGGTMSRFSKVSKVLGKLEATGDVHFELERSGTQYQLTVYKK